MARCTDLDDILISMNRIDITPDTAEYMSGYSREQKSAGVLDKLYVDYVRLESKETNLFLLSYDLLNLNKQFSEIIEKRINEKNVEKKNIIIICATHTHSGPAIFPLPSLVKEINPLLKENLIKKTMEVLDTSNIKKVDKMVFISGEINQDYGNRNDAKAYSDKSFFRIDIYSENKRIKTIVNLACHSTILKKDNLLFSADLFGGIRRYLEKKLDCTVMMLNGASGDNSSRNYSEKTGFEEIERLGKDIAKQILNEENKNIILENNFVKSIKKYESELYYKPSQDKFWISKKNILEQSTENELDKVLNSFLRKKLSTNEYWIKLRSNIIDFEMFYVITFSGELTSLLAKELRDSIKKPIIIIGYEFDYISYLVGKGDYGRYFESYLSRLPIGAADSFIDDIKTLL